MPVFDKHQSKIKMVILTKNGYENKVWYSPIYQNKRRSEVIIRAMRIRFAKQQSLLAVTQIIQFYENGIRIESYRI